MKLKMDELFSGHDTTETGSVVMVGRHDESGKMEILEWVHTKNAGVAEALAHSINFTAEQARQLTKRQ